jgi:hypothetical protein
MSDAMVDNWQIFSEKSYIFKVSVNFLSKNLSFSSSVIFVMQQEMTIRRKENRSSKSPYFFLIVLYLEKGYNQGKEERWKRILKSGIANISLKFRSSVLWTILS